MMRIAAVALLLVAARAAEAQPIYRCGNVYAQSPCAQARVVDADDARTAEQRSQARQVGVETRRLARELEAERLRAERRPVSGAASLGGAAPPAGAASHPAQHPSKKRRGAARPATDGAFVATVPSPRRVKP